MNPVSLLRRGRSLNLLLILLWMSIIFMGSATPQKEIPPQVSPLAKALHIMEYAILGFLMLPAVQSMRQPLLCAVILSAAYAATDEYHQLYVPGRHSSAVDVMIDSFGAIVGAYLAKKWGGL
jgi:VanZ family protein